MADVPERYDLGQGAGFYVDATQEPWARHYRMYEYVTRELPDLVEANLPLTDARSITGHSMGGHGALICALREPGRYRSVSAFAPICHPMACGWGQGCFKAYLLSLIHISARNLRCQVGRNGWQKSSMPQ